MSKQKYSKKCKICGRSIPNIVLEIDHIKPVSKNGGNSETNLITSCSECNLGKGDILLTQREIVRLKESLSKRKSLLTQECIKIEEFKKVKTI